MTDADLLEAIRAAPADPEPRLVYADWLLGDGDERGELITFDDADRRGHFQRFVDDPALHRLMMLAARHGFPRFPDDPDDTLLPFTPRGDGILTCTVAGASYAIESDREVIRAGVDVEPDDEGYRDLVDVDGVLYPNAVEQGLRAPEAFTAREHEVVLSIVSRALRLGRPLASIAMPYGEAIAELDRLCPRRPTQEHALFGVVDYERWGQLWQRWNRRP
ncbi:MAG: TIGR02996 domain-containing protein [Myxococcota bacterium]|nr:TIGR02996 domain-containing protein [Myxococcota bacterium]